MSDALFPLSDEHKMIRDTSRDFSAAAIAPVAPQFDESGEFPHETVKKMGEMGFMGIEIPEQYGGAGMDAPAYGLAVVASTGPRGVTEMERSPRSARRSISAAAFCNPATDSAAASRL